MLVGESLFYDISLKGLPDSDGILLDFGDAKRQIKRFIDDFVDHKLIVPQNRFIQIKKNPDQSIQCELQSEDHNLVYTAPESAFCFIPAPEYQPTFLAQIIAGALRTVLPVNITGIEIHMYPEINQYPIFHYSHGLQKHSGNCQRMGHGHRSQIIISIDQEYHETESRIWSETLNDRFIAKNSDLVPPKNASDPLCHFSYKGSQGAFHLSIPKSNCYFMDEDTTIESIGKEINEKIRVKFPNADSVGVRVYEGIYKGSFFEWTR